jgi:beta-lactamase class C
MKLVTLTAFVLSILCALFSTSTTSHAADRSADRVRSAVDDAVHPVMAKEHIPGMAVGITIAGKSWVFNYGVASTETHTPVTNATLFEVGSISKTFTATLTSWAQVDGRLLLSDKVEKFLPSLRNTPFGNVSLLNLGTHTPGGLPLQVPDNIYDEEQLMQYFKAWRPSCAPGSCRTYSNPSIGTLGLITANAMGQDFTTLTEQRLLPALGMKNTFINVPAAKMSDYAQGYTKEDRPVRMSTGVLSVEAYGIK